MVVKLTKAGKKLFRKIYLYRPKPDKIEDTLYCFNCSHNQIQHYFRRFGYNAVVISPLSLAKEMSDFFYFSSNKYKKLLMNKKDK